LILLFINILRQSYALPKPLTIKTAWLIIIHKPLLAAKPSALTGKFYPLPLHQPPAPPAQA